MNQPYQRKKVLVIEDEDLLRGILVEEFTEQEVDVVAARDGLEGLELALAEQPDLIILDLVMPRLDGMSMLKKLREDEWGKQARVLILTNAEGDFEKTMEALRHDVYEYMVKTRWGLKDVVGRAKEKLGIV
ncbi:MAG TPA: response regulator [Candidatus Paceibacterota bacterium]|nr:response regulator [Candidatus Paceibacterota bacterium]